MASRKNDASELIYKTEKDSYTQKTNLWLSTERGGRGKGRGVQRRCNEGTGVGVHARAGVSRDGWLGVNTCVKVYPYTLKGSVVSNSATPWTVARQVPLPMRSSRQDY